MNALESQGEKGMVKLLRRDVASADDPLMRLGAPWPVAALLSASLFLTACTTTPEPKIEVRTVNVPVAIKCAAQLNTEPTYSDTPESLRAAPDIFERTKLLLAGRAQRNARITELTAAISGCVG